MANAPKKMVIGSMAVAGFVALLAILDLVIKKPFSGSMKMDICFLIAAGIVGYMGWESYREMA